jgi:mRNA interferase RelE/StbE
MAWSVEFLPEAARELRRLDGQIAQRILRFLDERIRPLADPRSIGEALRGERLGAYWKYRVGDYRIICRIDDTRIVITIIHVGHRRDVYKDRRS